jgi:RNA polymerase sigma-70 factor (ECF subfamily)
MSAVPLPLPVDHATVGFRVRSSIEDTPHERRIIAEAVARGKRGDRDAIRFLYVRYAHNIFGYVRSIVHDDYEAEDVTQQVFAKLMSVLVKYDERGVPFFAWLLRLAHNAAIDHLRGRRAIPAEEVFGADERVDDDAVDRSCSLHEALAALPDAQRSVVVLRHVVGLTPAEIADRMGKSESSIHGLHHRGRRALQAELTERGSTPSARTLDLAA